MYCWGAESAAVAAHDDGVVQWRRTFSKVLPDAWPRWMPSGRWPRRCTPRPVSFWLRMVSTAMAVLPVWRSPMMSSRWPRPMGTMASMARMPVCSGTFTGSRVTTPGASCSMGAGLRGLDGAQAVNGLAQGVHRPAQHGVPHRDVGRPAGALGPGPLVEAGLAAQQDHAHAVPFQVQHHALGAGFKLDQLAVHRPVQAVDGGDTVADF